MLIQFESLWSAAKKNSTKALFALILSGVLFLLGIQLKGIVSDWLVWEGFFGR